MASKLVSPRVFRVKEYPSWRCARCRRSYTTNNEVFREKERVILESTANDRALPRLTAPLREGGKVDLGRGSISFNEIIGKRPRDVVHTRKGDAWRVNRPSLADYVLYTPRIVTPIYPADANLIVSLLDIHPPHGDPPPSGPFEILEAGTGHGSLTLHLARAVHAYNTASPVVHPLHYGHDRPPEEPPSSRETSAESSESTDEDIEKYSKWRSERRAIVHSLEASEKHLAHAKRIVHGFKSGLYFGNVDFHSGSLQPWLSSQLQHRPAPFLSHAILDLPQVSDELENVAKAMLANGTLVVFVPSITQIVKCVQTVRSQKLPLFLDDVLEIGVGAGTGGRQWNVKAVKPRALLKAEAEAEASIKTADDSAENVSGEEEGRNTDTNGVEQDADSGWEMVCRPKAFARVVGGGFLGIFKRIRDHS